MESKNFKQQQEKWEFDNLSKYAKKSSQARRWKPIEKDEYRTEYQIDVGRILYSDAFRRLRMKTQVFVASGLDQHNRTRLTHSIEVSQIAKSIARPLRLNIDLVESISLGHDLGHTPFGHAGERAINKCLEDRKKGTFNHNAQSVWIVQRSNAGYKNSNGKILPGLNLTYDTVEGILKHTKIKNPIEFEKLDKLKPAKPASQEGQLVNLADSIAYIKHDLDDAIKNNLLTENDIKRVWIENTDTPFKLNKILNYFIYDIVEFSSDKEIISMSDDSNSLYKALKMLSKDKILNSDKVKTSDRIGYDIICDIFDYYDKEHNFQKLLNKTKKMNKYIYETHGKERVIVDYIQWLGDETAKLVYNNINKSKSLRNLKASNIK